MTYRRALAGYRHKAGPGRASHGPTIGGDPHYASLSSNNFLLDLHQVASPRHTLLHYTEILKQKDCILCTLLLPLPNFWTKQLAAPAYHLTAGPL